MSRCTCVLVLGCLVFVAQVDGGDSRKASDLSALHRQFQQLSSLHFRAQVEILPGPGAVEPDCLCVVEPVAGEIQYWAEGNRYRILSTIEGDCYSWAQSEVAYDGRQFQLLRSDGTLIQSVRDDPRTVLPVVPNPLLELLQFMHPLTDANQYLRTRMVDVQKDSPPESFWRARWQPVRQQGVSGLERAVFPGGTYLSDVYEYNVYARPGQHDRPVRIDRVTTEGRLLSSSRFDAWVDVPGRGGKVTSWPFHVTMIGYDRRGTEAVRVDYFLYDVAVDRSYSSDIFRVQPAKAKRIWKDNEQRFQPAHQR